MRRADGDLLAWLLLGSLQGLRCMEIARLRGEDIDQDGGVLYVRGKGADPSTSSRSTRRSCG